MKKKNEVSLALPRRSKLWYLGRGQAAGTFDPSLRNAFNVSRLIGIERTGFQYGKYAKGSKTIVGNNYFCYEIWCFLG